ncbi:MAG: PA14 domain-containing protein [Verrucomicrobia bacterium]|nr:PA14 domain-containing protein [Verrucomicrobiota bacterium]
MVKARTVWPDGQMSRMVSFPMKQTAPLKATAATGTQPGLAVAVYELKAGPKNLPEFDRLAPAKTAVAERVNLKAKSREDNFGLEFTGFLTVPGTGVYLLKVASDDGAAVLPDGQPVYGKDGIHGMEESMGTVALEAGAHPLTVRYFQGSSGKGLRLDWPVPGGRFEEIPAAAYSHPGK